MTGHQHTTISITTTWEITTVLLTIIIIVSSINLTITKTVIAAIMIIELTGRLIVSVSSTTLYGFVGFPKLHPGVPEQI